MDLMFNFTSSPGIPTAKPSGGFSLQSKSFYALEGKRTSKDSLDFNVVLTSSGRLPASQQEKYLIWEMLQTSMKSLHHLDCQIVNGTFSEVGFSIGCSAVSSCSQSWASNTAYSDLGRG